MVISDPDYSTFPLPYDLDWTATELIAMAPVSWAKPKEVKLRTKDVEDFLRKKLWRKNNLKGERHGS